MDILHVLDLEILCNMVSPLLREFFVCYCVLTGKKYCAKQGVYFINLAAFSTYRVRFVCDRSPKDWLSFSATVEFFLLFM